MATNEAAFDMADFVDFGDTSIPGVSQGTDLNIVEPALDERCVRALATISLTIHPDLEPTCPDINVQKRCH